VTLDYAPTLTGQEFTWRPPRNVRLLELAQPLVELPLQLAHKRVGFSIFNPPHTALPLGFELIADKIAVFESSGSSQEQAKVAWLRFSNGIDLFSLFERKRPSFNTPPRYNPITAEWVAGPLHFTLVGQMRPTDANRLRAATVQALGRPGHAYPATR